MSYKFSLCFAISSQNTVTPIEGSSLFLKKRKPLIERSCCRKSYRGSLLDTLSGLAASGPRITPHAVPVVIQAHQVRLVHIWGGVLTPALTLPPYGPAGNRE